MKLIHISDLHLGITLKKQSLLEDQKYILDEIFNHIQSEEADVVLIAGDVYDTAGPSGEAVELFGNFLTRIIKELKDTKILIIYGNHDGGQKLSLAPELLEHSGVYISPFYQGETKVVTLEDKEKNKVHFYLLPFLRPDEFFLPSDCKKTYQEAVDHAVKKMNVNQEEVNVLMTHQYVDSLEELEKEQGRRLVRSESERDFTVIGGTDLVDVSVFDCFDYVALGHIHKWQAVSEKIYYSGSPLKYSLSEENHEKVVLSVEIGKKGQEILVEPLDLIPMRNLTLVSGEFQNIVNAAQKYKANENDYVYVELLDKEPLLNPVADLRALFPYLLQVNYKEIKRKGKLGELEVNLGETSKKRTPMDIVESVYQEVMEKRGEETELSSEQREFLEELIREIWEGEE